MATSANQTSYLKNMAAGKTSTGGTANAGQQKWATAQLAKVPAPTTATAKATTTVPKATQVVAPTATTTNTTNYGIPKSTEIIAPTDMKSSFSTPEYNDWSAKQTELFNQLQQKINTPFVYDPNTDAALQSQKSLYEAGAKKATDSAISSLNDRGIMNSSITGEQLAGIEQNANTQFNALIPQYQQQAYTQYQNDLASAGSLLNNAMKLRDSQFNEAVTEADLTGNYLPAGAQQLVDQVLALKAQAETKGLSAEDRAGLSSQADLLRTQLNGMGVNTAGIGSNVNSKNAQVGQRTLAGQAQDYNQSADTRNFNEDVRQYDTGLAEQIRQYDSNLDYTKIRDAVSDERWLSEFNENIRQFGMNNALDWAANAISRMNAGTSAGNLALNREEFNYRQSQDALDRAEGKTSSSSSSSSSKSSTTKVDAKASANAMYSILGDIENMMSKQDFLDYVRFRSDELTDADYKALLKRAEEEF